MSDAAGHSGGAGAVVEVRGGSRVVRAAVAVEHVASRESPLIAEAVIPAIERADTSLRYLVIDVAPVTFMNSMGLGMLIDLRRRADALGARTVLYRPSSDLRAMLEVVKVERLFTVVDDRVDLERLIG